MNASFPIKRTVQENLSLKSSKTKLELTPWCAEPTTECITEIISGFLVNSFMPRKPLSCWSAIVTAAPPIKPTTAAWERKSIRKPNLINNTNRQTTHKDSKSFYIYVF